VASFLILYPDIPKSALVVTPDREFFSETSPNWLENAFYGAQYSYAQITQNATSLSITFDMGTGVTRNPDYFLIGGTYPLRTLGCTQARLDASNDQVTWSAQLGTNATFASKTFFGPYDDDIIFTTAVNNDLTRVAGNYRYFRTNFAWTTSAKASFSRLFFGNGFDMGVEPSSYDMEVSVERDADTWRYPRGNIVMSKAYYPKHRITIEWDGVSDAKANEFCQKILSNPYSDSFYLYTSTHKDPLYDNTLINCKLLAESSSITKKSDVLNWNDIVAVFEEI
jgi:hypothetical protein